jgi:hypothetical protein
MKTMRFPGRVWLRQARVEWRLPQNRPSDGPPTQADIPMNVRSIRTKVMRQAKHK